MSSRLQRKLKRKNAPLCVYCGIRPGTTEDHVVPLSLFPDPKPPRSKLLIVPACPECNNTRLAHHQDYLRDLLVVEMGASAHPAARAVFNGAARRAMETNRSEVARAIKEGIPLEPLITREGDYLGDKYVLSIEQERTDAVFGLMVRGLYYISFGKRLPDDYSISISYIDRRSPLGLKVVWDSMWKAGVKESFSLGDGVFHCLFT